MVGGLIGYGIAVYRECTGGVRSWRMNFRFALINSIIFRSASCGIAPIGAIPIGQKINI